MSTEPKTLRPPATTDRITMAPTIPDSHSVDVRSIRLPLLLVLGSMGTLLLAAGIGGGLIYQLNALSGESAQMRVSISTLIESAVRADERAKAADDRVRGMDERLRLIERTINNQSARRPS